MKSNLKDKDNVCYAQPKTLEQRVAIANDFVKRFKFSLPFGIDDMTNAANDAYAAWPERIYIIDESGRIAYRGGIGPFNYTPEEAREWLAAPRHFSQRRCIISQSRERSRPPTEPTFRTGSDCRADH